MSTNKNRLPERSPTLRMLAMPTDTNVAGDIFGGWIMSQVDIAGSIAAYRQARGRVVTVAVNSFVFHKPVFVGDLVSLYAEITRIGTTSIAVDVVVYAERNRSQEQVIQVTEATLTYVAVDEKYQPRAVES